MLRVGRRPGQDTAANAHIQPRPGTSLLPASGETHGSDVAEAGTEDVHQALSADRGGPGEQQIVIIGTSAAGTVLPELAGILTGIHEARAKVLTRV
jgi:hypothetical protein